MNRFKTGLLALATCSIALVSSCSPVDQPSYTQSILRIVTVESNPYGLKLNVDYTGESFKFNNFNKESDMDLFKVRNGNRALASIEVRMVGDANLAQFNVLSLDTLKTQPLNMDAFQDTVGTLLDFAVLRLDNQFVYPKLWTNAQYLNVSPYFYPRGIQDNSKATFRLHPNKVSNDTLYLTMAVDSIASDTRYTPENRYYCYDLTTIRDTVGISPKMKTRMESILSQLNALNKDSLYITVSTCSTLETYVNDKISREKGKSITTKARYCF